MRSIRLFAKKNIGNPYYETTIVLHDRGQNGSQALHFERLVYEKWMICQLRSHASMFIFLLSAYYCSKNWWLTEWVQIYFNWPCYSEAANVWYTLLKYLEAHRQLFEKGFFESKESVRCAVWFLEPSKKNTPTLRNQEMDCMVSLHKEQESLVCEFVQFCVGTEDIQENGFISWWSISNGKFIIICIFGHIACIENVITA